MKRKAWVSQLKRHLEKFGPDGASWYVNWIDPDGKQRVKSCGAGELGKATAEKIADELHLVLLQKFVLEVSDPIVQRIVAKKVATHNEKVMRKVYDAADDIRVVTESDFPDRFFEQTKTRYGMTKEEVIACINAQRGRCSICGEHNPTGLCIDHCHQTNVVRGLICKKCNSGLGFFADKVEYIEKAADYLRNHPIGRVITFSGKRRRGRKNANAS